MSTPLISAIIPVYNGEKYLEQAIESLLNQCYKPLEVIVVDDGSFDGSAKIAQSFGTEVRYYYQPNCGLSVTQNKGIELASGAYISFLDSDDLWMPGKLTLQMKAFQAVSSLDMIFGHVQQFCDARLGHEFKSQFRFQRKSMPGYSTGTLLIKRQSFNRVGPFSSDLRLGQFVDWYAKAKDKGLKEFMLPEVLLKRRIHGNNMGIRDCDKRIDYLRVLKASLDRRRQSQRRKNVNSDQVP